MLPWAMLGISESTLVHLIRTATVLAIMVGEWFQQLDLSQAQCAYLGGVLKQIIYAVVQVVSEVRASNATTALPPR